MKSKKISFKTIFMIFLCCMTGMSLMLPFWAEATKIIGAQSGADLYYKKETRIYLLQFFSEELRTEYIEAGKSLYLNLVQIASWICVAIVALVAIRLVLFLFEIFFKKSNSRFESKLCGLILLLTVIEICLIVLVEINGENITLVDYILSSGRKRTCYSYSYMYSTLGWYILVTSGVILGMFSKPKKKKKD